MREWQEQQRSWARNHGYVTTLLGRRRILPDINSNHPGAKGRAERAAINTPIQGSAADVAAAAMIAIDCCQELKDLGWVLLLQVAAALPSTRLSLFLPLSLPLPTPAMPCLAVCPSLPLRQLFFRSSPVPRCSQLSMPPPPSSRRNSHHTHVLPLCAFPLPQVPLRLLSPPLSYFLLPLAVPSLTFRSHPYPCRVQVHDEVMLEGPQETADRARELVVECMQKPFNGANPLLVELTVDSNIAPTWYEAK